MVAPKIRLPCGHQKTVLAPGKGPHAARLLCRACGRFVRWVRRDEIPPDLDPRDLVEPRPTQALV